MPNHAEEYKEFRKFVALLPADIQAFMADDDTVAAGLRSKEMMEQTQDEEGFERNSSFFEGMIEGLKCGVVVFTDMIENRDARLVLEAAAIGGMVASCTIIEQCYAELGVAEGNDDETRESNGSSSSPG